jgi:hypothetical protein
MRARVPAIVTALALLVPLAACSDDGDAAVLGDPAQASANGVTVPPTDDSADDPTDQPSDGETTAPGTELSYGDTATVELETFTDSPGIAEYTVTSVGPGTDDDSGVITSFRVQITLTAKTDLTGTFLLPSLDFDALDSAGETTIFNVEDGCEDKVDTSTMTAGKSVDLCVSVAAFNKGDLTAVRYTGGDAYDDRGGEPILWKP